MDYYQLHRNFWDFAFNNPEKIKPAHCAIFSFTIEHCNRLGWREKFGLPSRMVMDAIGMKCHNSYLKALNELIEFGFFVMLEKSKNQWSANIIAVSNFDEAHNKALDRAIIKHASKHSESTHQSINNIIRPIYHNTNIQEYQSKDRNEIFVSELLESQSWIETICMQNKLTIPEVKKWLDVFALKLKSEMDVKNSKKEFCAHFSRWLPGEMMKVKNNKTIDVEKPSPWLSKVS